MYCGTPGGIRTLTLWILSPFSLPVGILVHIGIVIIFHIKKVNLPPLTPYVVEVGASAS
jgi:hypothetical protein